MPKTIARWSIVGAMLMNFAIPVYANDITVGPITPNMVVPLVNTEAPPSSEVRYDFDRVKAVYGLEFQARPQAGVSADSWIAQLAGGPTEPISVLFGAVYLYKDGQNVGKEHFLKVEGKNGSRRFLENSMKNTFAQEGDSAPSTIAQFFWSAKQLEGDSIIKNLTSPIISTTLWRDPNPNGGTMLSVTGLTLDFSNDGNAAADAFWTDGLKTNGYVGQMDTVREWTEPCVSAGNCLDQ